MLLQKYRMAIYIKSTILKLKKNIENVRKSIFVFTEHAKFQKATFNSNWDVKPMKQNILGSIPSPHQIHSCPIISVLDQYLHLTMYILVLYF